MVIGPPIKFSDTVSLACCMDKHPIEKFDKGKSWRDSVVLQLDHNDVASPFPCHHLAMLPMSSLSLMTILASHGSTFLVTRVKCLTSLSFKVTLKSNHGKLRLCIHNGREYINTPLEEFCTLEGIELQH